MAGCALYYGDNLQILREYFRDETVNLIYLDPPFNSNRSYNVLFRDESGQESDAQITAFDDSWHWGQTAEETYDDLVRTASPSVVRLIGAMREFVGTNQMMAYLVMMTARLVELHRVLAPTGSLYLHCDPTASHYLKVILDTIFGAENYRSEITWKRTSNHNDARRGFSSLCDIILYYTKSSDYVFHPQHTGYSPEYAEKNFRYVDDCGRRYSSADLRSPSPRPNLTYDYKGYKPHPNGWAVSLEKMQELDQQGRLIFPSDPSGRIRVKKYLDEMPGVVVGNVWDDIPPIGAQAAERLGYPTQKPLTLLERIIQASSNPGDLVLDPFSGCGTAITAAQKLGRRWAGIDITHLAIAMHKSRLKDMYGLAPDKDYQVIGEPQDLEGARQLAQEDRYQFQWWALSLIQARPTGGTDKRGKKGADQGIDGQITFMDDRSKKVKRILVQVKSGHVRSGDVRDLRGVLDREKDAAMGVLITLEPPTNEMCREAASARLYRSELWQRDYPRLQILTIEELLHGKALQAPPQFGTFKSAQRERTEAELMQPEIDIWATAD